MDNEGLATVVSEKTGLSHEKALKLIGAFAETINEYLHSGEKVTIADFGTFVVQADHTIQFQPVAKHK